MPVGRRERNKEEKLERILAAATELFAVRGVDEVTTQQIADAADIGTGTLFLYAKNKGELLLMVQNTHYADALAEGVAAADDQTDPIDALMAIVSPIIACNRAHAGNGRTYLREMVFGDPTDDHHARALAIVDDTETQLARSLLRTTRCDAQLAGSVSRAVSALLLRNLAAPAAVSGSVDDILATVRLEVSPLVALFVPTARQ
jgi:AcrR family transcriptional regulator